MAKVDFIIHSAAQLVTCANDGNEKRRQALQDVGMIVDGAVAVSDGLIVATGQTAAVLADYSSGELINASGHVVCPGFVDSHTHVVYAGDRIQEFESKIQGAPYMEILQAGGGILSTMRATRQATVEELVDQSLPRLNRMLSLGTTTIEVKTGYGLDLTSEMNMLKAIEILNGHHPADLVPTFLGAHALPPEFTGREDEYVDFVVEEMIPAAGEWFNGSVFAKSGIPLFCDVFCEAGVFDLNQTARILKSGVAHGMIAKVHADEFKNLGGVSLAIELEAASADHLDVTPSEEIVQLGDSDVVGVLLPAVNFHLGSMHFARARDLVQAGALVALATDINPGSAPCPSMPMVMAIACRYQKLSPAEALNACTLNAARAVRRHETTGSIEAGKQADILMLQVPDYRYLSYEFGSNFVAKVFKRGRLVYALGHR